MEVTKSVFNHLTFSTSVIFITIIIIVSFSNLSFAKENIEHINENVQDLKYTPISSSIVKEMDKIMDNKMKETSANNNISSSSNNENIYPDHFYACGYPIHLITDQYLLEKSNNCETR